jgi:heme o synthase
MGEASRELLVGAVARDRRQVVTDLVALAKPRVLLMVLVTTLAGYDAAGKGAPDYPRMLHLLVGTVLAAGGTLALNQWWERDLDARMARTRARPLPDGRLQPWEGLLWGAGLCLSGVAYLAAMVGAAVAWLTAATAVLYLFVYTPLKQRTALCTLVGAVPGALPPVTGWVAASNEMTLGAWVLFAVLFLWQLPHTLAIARVYCDDYARAGVRVLPGLDPEGPATERQIVLASVALLAVSLMPSVMSWTGAVYLAGALGMGLALVACAVGQLREPSARAARQVVWASLLYLPLLLCLLAIDKR